MGFKATTDKNVSNRLKLTEKVVSTRNVRSNNKGVLINVNQQSKTFDKQTGKIYLTNYPQTFDQQRQYQFSKGKNYFLDQTLARNFED